MGTLRTIQADFVKGIETEKNYISNSTFENNSTTGWSAQKFTFSSGKPTGYGAAVNFSLSPTPTNPLSGNYSLLLSNAGGTSSQYEGFLSSSFFVDRQDLAKVLHGSFSYEVVSGDVDCSGTSTQTLEIWIQNFNTGEWIQPAGWRGMNQNSGSGVVTFTFQTDSNSANNEYKLAILTQQSGTGAYSVKFDNFKLGSESIVLGCPVTDWQSYNMIITATAGTVVLPTSGLTTNTAKWRRVGDSVEIMYSYQTGTVSGGTSPTGEYLFSLPPGLVIDDTKLDPTGTAPKALGVMRLITATARDGMVVWNPADTDKLRILFESSGTDLVAVTGSAVPFMTTNNASLSFTAKLPIVGWSSNVQFSNDTDTRVVTSCFTTTKTSTTTMDTITLTTVTDTHGGKSGNTYIIPVSGLYNISCLLNFSTGNGTVNDRYARILVDGTTIRTTIATSSYLSDTSVQTCISLNAGQIVSFQGQSAAIAGSVTGGQAIIQRLSGPSVIAASESVNAAYYLSANFTSSPSTPVNFDVKEIDTHNAVTTSPTAWKFTAPISGTYEITCYFYFSNLGTTMGIFVNGTKIKTLQYASSAIGQNSTGVALIRLDAGERVDLRASVVSTTVTGGALTSTNVSYVSIKKVGN